ncbi:MAG TPA: peptidylprolyl isomerase, partial [Oceanipulchritudo sp.]|nr:peptidylprolyl isomerase [Oceanipulchritudo sp.]
MNTRLHPYEIIASGADLQLELRDHFQRYADPGPVATFTLYMPVQAGWMEIDYDTGGLSTLTDQTLEGYKYMTYQLAAGGTYSNAFEPFAEEFVWRPETVQYQLLADVAPITVANFMTYADRGVYNNTIVHRSEINVLQAGGLRISDSDDYLLQWIETMPPIVFEQTKTNTQGTLSMARQNALDTATSQFFINLEDNSAGFGSFYTVFGELIELESKLPLLKEMGDVSIFNLTQPPVNWSHLPFASIPLYTPYYDDKGSYVRFQGISIPDGNPDGITYSWAFVTNLSDSATDEQKAEEAANQAVFDITLPAGGSNLSISRHDTGQASIEVTGTYSGTSRSFRINMTAYNPEALDAFP